jgi:hypothetical protein
MRPAEAGDEGRSACGPLLLPPAEERAGIQGSPLPTGVNCAGNGCVGSACRVRTGERRAQGEGPVSGLPSVEEKRSRGTGWRAEEPRVT